MQAEFGNINSLQLVSELPNLQLIACSISWLVADELQLLQLAVHPEYQRQGFAREHLQRLLQHAQQRGAAVGLLEVRADNVGAIALYTQAGFAIVHTRKQYYADGCDGLLMNVNVSELPLQSVDCV